MTDDLIPAPNNYNCIINVTIRDCASDARLFDDSFFLFADTWESYQFQIEDLHQLISNVATTYVNPVYIREAITELNAGAPFSQRVLQ